MAIALVQAKGSVYSAGVTSAALTFTSNNTAGNFIGVFVSGSSNSGFTISDTNTNTYTNIFSDAATFGTSNVQRAYYALNIGSGANTVTASWTGATTAAIAIVEYSGIALTSALDQSGGNTGSGNWSTASLTTVFANELLLAFDANANGVTSTTAPFTKQAAMTSGGDFAIIADNIVSSTGTYQATGNGNAGAFSAWLATFKQGAAAATSQPVICILQ